MADADRSAFEAMLSGRPYYTLDPYVRYREQAAREKVALINAESDGNKRMALYKQWAANMGEQGTSYVSNPVYIKHISNLWIGDKVHIGPNAVILDIAPITIGNGCMIGPSCNFYTPDHPVDPEERLTDFEWATPIVIEDNCWLGGNVTVLGGVTIGAGSTIGAGTVVTKNVPSRSVVVGNPGRVVRTIPVRPQGGETECQRRERWVTERENALQKVAPHGVSRKENGAV